MRGGIRLTALGLAGLVLLSASAATAQARRDGLTAFRTDDELRAFLQARVRPPMPPAPPPPPVYVMPVVPEPTVASPSVAPSSAPSQGQVVDYLATVPQVSAEAVPGSAADYQDVVVTGSRADDPSITNVQEIGVDEGGIVKVRGDYLIILRRGRLFTVSTADGGLRPVDSINAYPPNVDGGGDWYDEMLVSGDQVIVIGYSYARGGTEINRFRLSPDGRLTFRDAYHMRSSDYYSSRNYASRLIGTQLITYAPLYLDWGPDPLDALPGLRRWTGDKDAPFQRIAGPRQVFIAPQLRRSEDGEIENLHTVSRCDLTALELTCEATVVLGPEGRSFYVSSEAVYLWTSEGWRGWQPGARDDAAESSLYRIPLDGSRPQAVRTRGAPLDQFSFREDRRGQALDVFVLSEGGGDEMWRPEFAEGAPALLHLPLERFGDGSREAPASDYRFLPAVPGGDEMHNRFVGDHLLYSGNDWNARAGGQSSGGEVGTLKVAPVRAGAVQSLAFNEPITRLEVLGRDALVVSGDDEVAFSTVDLSGRPAILDRYVAQAAGEAEDRSHAFFFQPDSADGASGMLGLPVQRSLATPRDDYLFSAAADMLYLRRDQRRLSEVGRLESRANGAVDDDCVASCTDWYGNARPIFLRGRVFALLGYELVEGRMDGGRIREIGRIDYAPVDRRPEKDPKARMQ